MSKCKNRQVSQVKPKFIGRSGPNRSALYLYRATSVGLSATLSHVHVQVWKRCGLCTLTYVLCTWITMCSQWQRPRPIPTPRRRQRPIKCYRTQSKSVLVSVSVQYEHLQAAIYKPLLLVLLSVSVSVSVNIPLYYLPCTELYLVILNAWINTSEWTKHYHLLNRKTRLNLFRKNDFKLE